MAARSDDLPAVLGGAALRPEGPPSWPPADPAIGEALDRAFADGSWGRYHGQHVPALVERLKADHGVAHAIPCSSGTVAVELALRGLRIGPGDEVVLAAYDFEGNFGDVLAVGAVPVLVDIRPENWNLDVSRLEAAFSDRTRAVLVSHLHGGMVPMREVLEFARARNTAVVEDACQMPGAIVDGRVAGSWGDVGVLSFGGSKLLSAGRGGALLTDRDDVAQRCRLHTHRGNETYPLSELQAAVLLPQLDRLDERNAVRAANVSRLRVALAEHPGLSPFENMGVDARPGYYKVGFRYDRKAFAGLPRDGFSAALRAEGIALDPGFRALHRTHGRRRYRAGGTLEEADIADEGVLVLHHPILLGDAAEMTQIVDAVDKLARHARMVANWWQARGSVGA